jgi:hypothetical protein
MKKVLCILSVTALAFFFVPRTAGAQALGHDYNTGLGVKVGWWGGGALDVKHFTRNTVALEGLLSFWSHGATITGLYEFHGPVTGAPGLKWYVGPGAHVGFWSTKYKNEQGYGGAFFGVDGVLGLDYKFNGAPIDLSIDIQPLVSIPDGGFDIWGGLGIRFTL